MKVLGLSYDFHDAAAALVVDGRVIASASEERFTRQKHDDQYPRFAIEHCLAAGGISASDIDQVVFYEDPAQKFGRVLCSSLSGYPRSSGEFIESMKVWLGKKLWTVPRLSKRLGIGAEKIHCLSHHQSHLAQAFLGSGFEESAILVVDAVGEWSTVSLGMGIWGKEGLELKTLEETRYPHSLGLFYSAFTAFLGFKPMNDECTTMALAAFGKPIHADAVRKVLQITSEGQVTINPEYLQFDAFLQKPYQPAFIRTFGEPRDENEPLTFSAFEETNVICPRQQRYADIAASVQLVFEEALLTLAKRLRRITGSSRLCFAGGAAMNCVANSRLLKEVGFDELYIPVDPGDGGAAMGAALAMSITKSSVPTAPYTPYLGAAFDEPIETETLRLLADKRSGWEWTQHETQDALLHDVTEDLADGRVIGWFQGRFEIGPRALGNRSLLFRPDRQELALKVSTQVKKRALYRPYALSMTEASAENLLPGYDPAQKPYHWMQLATPVVPSYRESVRSGLHVDGTTRPQVCTPGDNPLFHALLKNFEAKTGLPALINTSLNERGYPIATSPLEALAIFARTKMDTLVVNRLVIRKRRSPS